jgi:hypothetical protein
LSEHEPVPQSPVKTKPAAAIALTPPTVISMERRVDPRLNFMSLTPAEK